uniref:F-box domain-containing protein n=2 Tax=Sarcophilus harrisii TaxID=9305 RepID=A0A7N4P0G1_SARHA
MATISEFGRRSPFLTPHDNTAHTLRPLESGSGSSTGVAMATASELPDCLLVEILSFVPLRDRIRSSRVCKRWQRLVLDKALWKCVDLSPYVVEPNVLWQLMRQYFGPGVRSFKMRGRLLSGPRGALLTPALLQALGKRCSNLAYLSLIEEDLRKISFSCLPTTLRYLDLQWCELPQTWFSSGDDPGCVPHLEHLVLDRVPAFSDAQLLSLSHFGTLCSLVLRVTYRVTYQGFLNGLPGLSHLQRLELCGCSVPSDLTLQIVGKNMPRLKELRVTVTGLTAQGLGHIKVIKPLELLGLMGPPCTLEDLSVKDILTFCVSMPNLKTLSLQGLRLESKEEAVLKEGLTHCVLTVEPHPLEGEGLESLA